MEENKEVFDTDMIINLMGITMDSLINKAVKIRGLNEERFYYNYKSLSDKEKRRLKVRMKQMEYRFKEIQETTFKQYAKHLIENQNEDKPIDKKTDSETESESKSETESELEEIKELKEVKEIEEVKKPEKTKSREDLETIEKKEEMNIKKEDTKNTKPVKETKKKEPEFTYYIPTERERMEIERRNMEIERIERNKRENERMAFERYQNEEKRRFENSLRFNEIFFRNSQTGEVMIMPNVPNMQMPRVPMSQPNAYPPNMLMPPPYYPPYGYPDMMPPYYMQQMQQTQNIPRMPFPAQPPMQPSMQSSMQPIQPIQPFVNRNRTESTIKRDTEGGIKRQEREDRKVKFRVTLASESKNYNKPEIIEIEEPEEKKETEQMNIIIPKDMIELRNQLRNMPKITNRKIILKNGMRYIKGDDKMIPLYTNTDLILLDSRSRKIKIKIDTETGEKEIKIYADLLMSIKDRKRYLYIYIKGTQYQIMMEYTYNEIKPSEELIKEILMNVGGELGKYMTNIIRIKREKQVDIPKVEVRNLNELF